MTPYQLRLFGTPKLYQTQTPVELERGRLMELIALLALNAGRDVSRQQIAHTFWPESSESQARTNVRGLLHRLRKIWPEATDLIEFRRSQLRWQNTDRVTVDVHRFNQILASEDHASRSREPLMEAVSLYQGDFMADHFSDWVLVERERLRGEYTACLERLATLLMDKNRAQEALSWAKKLQLHEPLRESSYRLLMRVYAAIGDRAAALSTYHRCVAMLEKELGVTPSPASEKLYKRLMHQPQTLAITPGADPSSAGKVSAEKVSTEKVRDVQRPQLIGRQPEWRSMLDRWRTAQTGKPGVVAIHGEAGIGKTRLAEELVDWVNRQGHIWASSRSYAARGALSYAPIAEWLRSPHLRARLERLDDLWQVELGRLLPELLTTRPDLPTPGPLREDWQRQRFYEGLRHALIGNSKIGNGETGRGDGPPLLLHLDDLQWTDAQTLEALTHLLFSAKTAPFLLLTTIRSEEAPQNPAMRAFFDILRKTGGLTELSLAPLSQKESEALAAQTANHTFAPAEMSALYASSEGHPLFLIETIRASDHQSKQPADSSAQVTDQGSTIPAKIYSLIAGRLGQLSEPAQHLAAVAAVIGREFRYPILAHASGQDDRTLVDSLDELWQLRIVREKGESGYDFNHDRIREVAYARVSRARRRLLHRRVAKALEADHADSLDAASLDAASLDAIAGTLAEHYRQAGDGKKAQAYYERAGRMAVTQNALSQAESYFQQAIQLVPPTDWLRQFNLRHPLCKLYEFYTNHEPWKEVIAEQEIILQHILADPELTETTKNRCQMIFCIDKAWFTRFIQSDQVAILSLCRQAISLAEMLGDIGTLSKAYLGMGYASWTLTDLPNAQTYYLKAGHFARLAGDQDVEAAALEWAAATGMFSGMQHAEIWALLDRAEALATEDNNLPRLAGICDKFGYLETAHGTGNFDQAAESYRRGLGYVQQTNGRLMASVLLRNLGHLDARRGNYREAQDQLDEAIQIADYFNDRFHRAVAVHYMGFALMQQGAYAPAEAALTDAKESIESVTFSHFQIQILCDLGLLYHLQGRQQEAMTEMEKGFALVSRHEDSRFQGHFCVRMGYVMEALGHTVQARTAYLNGITYHNATTQRYFAAYGQAGLARLHHQAEETVEAESLARQVWNTLTSQEPEATIETTKAFVTCARILARTDPDLAAVITHTAQEQLHHRASTLNDPQRQAEFWDLPDHQAVMGLGAPSEGVKSESGRLGD